MELGEYQGLPYTTDAKKARLDYLTKSTLDQRIKDKPPEEIIVALERPFLIRRRILKNGKVVIEKVFLDDAPQGVALKPEVVKEGGLVECSFNPPGEIIERKCDEANKNGGVVIVDIGSGGGISSDLKKGDVYLAIDSYTGEKALNKMMVGLNKVEIGSSVLLLNAGAEDVDVKIKPDLVMAIAPNPNDVWDGKMIVGMREKFLDSNLRARALIVLETGSLEAVGVEGNGAGVRDLIKTIKQLLGSEYLVSEKWTSSYHLSKEMMNANFGVERELNITSNSFPNNEKVILRITHKAKRVSSAYRDSAQPVQSSRS